MITWSEPTLNPNNGYWYLRVEGLTFAQVNAVYAHAVCAGSFIFPHPGTGKANPTMSVGLVRELGAQRCYWLLREDILDAGESDALGAMWGRAIADALAQPNVYDAELDGDDDPSPYGTLL